MLAVASIPLVTDDGYVNAVVFDTLIFCLLAIGLNVVVGWGGLLDLGYIAFFGVGAYTYAILSSEKFDLHLSSLVVMAICVVLGALLGLLVGLPSWRLSGDYLAIVTLFVYQIFISIVTNGHDLFGVDLTGGVNGIANVDPFDLFGIEIVVSKDGIFNSNYVYVALGVFLAVFAALYLVNHSRIGRAWRALREDTLAAELMGMPTDWLKLLAFAFGAAVAALTGLALRVAQGRGLPRDLLADAPHHRLRDADPGRRREPDRRRARRGRRLRLPRGVARSRRVGLGLLPRSAARARARRPPALDGRGRARRDGCLRLRGACGRRSDRRVVDDERASPKRIR